MVVEDTTDECKTLINPAKLMDDIYRIWCETKTVRRRQLPDEKLDPYDSYFENEYKDYSNPRCVFQSVPGNDDKYVSEWDVCEDSDPFEITLPQNNGGVPDGSTEMFKSMLDEYYVSILRSDKGQFLNEKRYILPPTKLSEFVLEMKDTPNDSGVPYDGYVDCKLGKYLSSSIEGNHYVSSQVVFAGTPNPFNYDAEGNKIYSKAETLQYGNGIVGVDGLQLKIDIVSEEWDEPKRDIHGNIISTEKVEKGDDGVSRIVVYTEHVQVTKKFLRPYVKFIKYIRRSQGDIDDLSLVDRVHNNTNSIEEGQITIVLSHKNLDNIAKYHILNTSSNLYFNGSLPKTGEGQFKYSDFKFSRTLTLEDDDFIILHKDKYVSEITLDTLCETTDRDCAQRFKYDVAKKNVKTLCDNVPTYKVNDFTYFAVSWKSNLHTVDVTDSSGRFLGYVSKFKSEGFDLVGNR